MLSFNSLKGDAPDVNDENALDITQKMIAEENENFSATNGNHDDQIQAPQSSPDFVLVYMENSPQHNQLRRDNFERSLLETGLRLEYEQNKNLCFVKIFASKEVLCRYCEVMKLRMPIKNSGNLSFIEENDIFDEARSCFRKLFNFAQLDPKKFPPDEYQISAEFSKDKDYLFDIEDENFFPNHVRVMIIDFILERLCEGIQRLVAEGVYTAAYPLHDGPIKQKGNLRSLLYNDWGSIKTSNWLKVQPLDTIREYFGINFAMYFAWLGYYTYLLIPASIAGFICFFYGLLTRDSNQLAKEACDSQAEKTIMCPLCDRTCDYWRLNETCVLTQVTYLFDNPATVYFAVFMSIWSVIYLELWKRRSAELSYRWGLATWDKAAEPARPQYLSRISNIQITKIKEKINPVTGMKEPYVSFWKVRVPATLLSFSVVLLLTALAIAAVFAVVLYRMSMITTTSLFGQEVDSTNYKTFTLPAIAASINLVFILILNYIYDWVAVYLTEMEMLRTQAEFDDSLTLKIYLFQFVNYYASIFYIAFIKGKFVGYPKKYNKIFGFRQEECAPGGCLMELSIQLAIIMVGKQAVYTIMEMLLPIFYKYWALIRIHTGLKQKDPIVARTQWIRDLKLLEWSPRGLADEYLEMVVQFGFITLFVVAFPLAPFFALANNLFEMRLDATKFLCHYRKPVPKRARDIGIWSRILDGLAKISVTSNAFIIAFSSTLIPRLVYMSVVSPDETDVGFLNHSLAYFDAADFPKSSAPLNSSFTNVITCRYTEYRNPPNHPELPYKRPTIYWQILVIRLAFVVIFQNAVGLIAMAVQWCLSGIPRDLQDRIKREAYLVEELIIKEEAERAKKSLILQNFANKAKGNNMKKRNSITTNSNTSGSTPV